MTIVSSRRSYRSYKTTRQTKNVATIWECGGSVALEKYGHKKMDTIWASEQRGGVEIGTLGGAGVGTCRIHRGQIKSTFCQEWPRKGEGWQSALVKRSRYETIDLYWKTSSPPSPSVFHDSSRASLYLLSPSSSSSESSSTSSPSSSSISCNVKVPIDVGAQAFRRSVP